MYLLLAKLMCGVFLYMLGQTPFIRRYQFHLEGH
jgi:hypothetical protein